MPTISDAQVKVARSAEEDDEGHFSSTVTVEIPVASEADGYAVLTYVLAIVEGSSTTTDRDLTVALNDALSRRTVDGCECIIIASTTSTAGWPQATKASNPSSTRA